MVGSLLLGGCVVEGEDQESLGHEQSEIVGGTDAEITSFPYQVSLQLNGSHYCGASVLSSTWVLTAQHCVKDLDPKVPWLPPALIKVVAGSSNVTDLSAAQVRDVVELVPLAGFVDPSLGKDATLMRLGSALDLSTPSVKAVPILTPAGQAAGATDAGVVATVTGWGTLSEGGDLAEILQAVDVPIVSNAEASPPYEALGLPPLTSDQLAAGVMGIGGKDSCQGDSGGPLVVEVGGVTTLAGIVSWGVGCAEPEYAGLYGRVASFSTWINSVPASTLFTALNSTNQSAKRNAWKYYTVTVPANALVLNVKTSGGSGNADLFVRFGSRPTLKANACASRLSANDEYCSLAAPAAGTWHIGVRGGSSTFSGVTVNATRR